MATHQRESVTPVPGGLLANCSCGGKYQVAQGGDEITALNEAQAQHAWEESTSCPECQAPPGEECAPWCTGSMETPCERCRKDAEGVYCQVCKKDMCAGCLTGHSHGLDEAFPART